MLRPRVIPCLLVSNKGLVKTVKFNHAKYVGDPINAVRIFNEKRVDELMVLDILSTMQNTLPDYQMIGNLAAESQMPLCYGGGIASVEQALKIINLGVEKVALSSAILANPRLVKELATEIGSQSVVAILDVKSRLLGRKYEIWTHNGKINAKKCPIEFSKLLQDYGVGEIVLNSIDRDGVMKGYDLSLVKQVREQVQVPMTILGGAGAYADIKALVTNFGIIGAAVGSLFVFKGQYKAVLISYLTDEQKENLARCSTKAVVN